MRIRTRKFIGTIGLLVLITAWALFSMAIAQFMLRSANVVVQALFYCSPGSAGCCPRCRW